MITEQAKEQYAIVLDFLQNGYAFDQRPSHRKTPIAQAIGKDFLVLLEIIPKKDQFLQPYEEVYMGEGKRDKVHHIAGRIPFGKLTETAKTELNYVLKKVVEGKEKTFVDFFNKAGPINTRRHQFELLPGIGKKHMWELIKSREEKLFENFADIKGRVKLIPDPEKLIVERILAELQGKDRHKIFVR
jgi:putative nucleotide binding protein